MELSIKEQIRMWRAAHKVDLTQEQENALVVLMDRHAQSEYFRGRNIPRDDRMLRPEYTRKP